MTKSPACVSDDRQNVGLSETHVDSLHSAVFSFAAVNWLQC